MDTDLIFKRGVAYTLATSLILGGYFGVIALATLFVHKGLPDAVREWAMLLTILITAAIFDPIKRRIQGWVDRVFDQQRYDYRKALIEFGRGLSSETNLERLLVSIVEQLPHTLLVARVAVFLARETGGLWSAHGLSTEALTAHDSSGQSALMVDFLDFDQAEDHSHIFLENAQVRCICPPEQGSAALLDLNYYLPCRVAQGQTRDEQGPPEPSPSLALARPLVATSFRAKMWNCSNPSPFT